MPADIKAVLNLLKSFRGKSRVQEFLESRDIPHSGTWATLQTRIREATQTGNTEIGSLVKLLEEIEEHGNQYVFLYDIDVDKSGKAITPEAISDALTTEERKSVLNAVLVIEKPQDKAVLVSVNLTHNPVKLKWVQKRFVHRLIGETIKGNRLTVEYDIEPTRAVDLAILDETQKKAYLCVQRVETGVLEYRKHLSEFRDRLKRFVNPEALIPLDLGKLMKTLADETFTEVKRRRHQVRDGTGAVVDAMSATEADDVFSGGLYKAARKNYLGALTDLQANVYWLPNKVQLERQIHTLFPYRNFPNAVVFTQRCSKGERDYVLSRVEGIARK
jgi:hypothetical protein